MQSNETTHGKFVLTTPAVLSLFGVKSNPNPDDPDRPGPWGPVVRRAAERAYADLPAFIGWRDPDTYRFDAAFAKALAEEVIDRVNLVQQIADAMPQTGNAQPIIIIGGILKEFRDGCGFGRIKYPLPPPRHHDEVRLSPSQLVVIAAQFQERANEATNEGLRQEFVKTSEHLLETGLGRLQSATAQAAG
jgi:hypothetical protein